ncbi:hypothetical protein RHSIM_Rhsim04G0130300 [Rhododendron simsii]|uniref:Peptidase S54 rhomboid domain-containing protein n=1 Tax=Rhododendron simsii TaxID=118357 RepID=A0A834H338_RHOSS|nr:hypothetical protein RHSIM_Rhsim04G0130300 [Rhododendron simsii]
MRPNIVSEAGLPTRVGQWWGDIPFLSSTVIIVCGVIYLVCLLVGYDSFAEVCFWPLAVISRFQVYRIFTSIVFHGSLLHVLFNMMAFVPLGSELERVMGSVRLLYMIILLAASNAVFHLLIAVLAAHNPFHSYQYLMDECAIGFSGILFSMIVIETSLSGVQYRSVFGLFNVPAKWYAWILLVVFQLLMTNASLLGHLCGILSGFAYSYGLFNFLLPGTSLYSAIESSSLLSACVRRPKFILCTGGSPSSYIPTFSSQNTIFSGSLFGNFRRNLSSWMPQRGTSVQDWAVLSTYRLGKHACLLSGKKNLFGITRRSSSLDARIPNDANRNVKRNQRCKRYIGPRRGTTLILKLHKLPFIRDVVHWSDEGKLDLLSEVFERLFFSLIQAVREGDWQWCIVVIMALSILIKVLGLFLMSVCSQLQDSHRVSS